MYGGALAAGGTAGGTVTGSGVGAMASAGDANGGNNSGAISGGGISGGSTSGGSSSSTGSIVTATASVSTSAPSSGHCCFPMQFVGIVGQDVFESEAGTFYNPMEASKVLELGTRECVCAVEKRQRKERQKRSRVCVIATHSFLQKYQRNIRGREFAIFFSVCIEHVATKQDIVRLYCVPAL